MVTNTNHLLSSGVCGKLCGRGCSLYTWLFISSSTIERTLVYTVVALAPILALLIANRIAT